MTNGKGLYAILAAAFLTLATFSVTAQTRSVRAQGGSDGGGGNARVCFDSEQLAKSIRDDDRIIPDSALAHIKSIEVLDLFEAKQITPRGPIVAPAAGSNPFQYVDQIAERLRLNAPIVTGVLEERRKSVSERRFFFSDFPLKRIFDTAELHEYELGACIVTTMAARSFEGNNIAIRVDNRLFSHPKHSETSKGVLVLHEMIYSLDNARAQGDSRNTRVLVGMLISKSSASLREWLEEALGLKILDYQLSKRDLDPVPVRSYSYPALFLGQTVREIDDRLRKEWVGFYEAHENFNQQVISFARAVKYHEVWISDGDTTERGTHPLPWIVDNPPPQTFEVLLELITEIEAQKPRKGGMSGCGVAGCSQYYVYTPEPTSEQIEEARRIIVQLQQFIAEGRRSVIPRVVDELKNKVTSELSKTPSLTRAEKDKLTRALYEYIDLAAASPGKWVHLSEKEMLKWVLELRSQFSLSNPIP